MRIYLDARNITAQPAGVARYAQCLIPEMVKQAPHHDFVVIRHASNDSPLAIFDGQISEAFVDDSIGKLSDFLFGRRWLRPLFARHGAPDIYHNLFHISPLGVPCKHVITLHDFIWVDYPKQSQGTWPKAVGMYTFGRIGIGQTLRRADRVIAISNATATGARRWIKQDKMDIIGHGVEAKYFDTYDGDLPWSWTGPYLLAVANDKPYKNLQLVIRAFAQLRSSHPELRLVLVGRCTGLNGLIQSLGVQDAVHMPGFLSEAQLMSVFQHATLFTFPSLVEGYGLPPLEAMAMGVPSIVSEVEPMRSVVADAALTLNPNDVGQWRDAIDSLLRNPEQARILGQRGRDHAATKTWEKTAQATLRVYDQVQTT